MVLSSFLTIARSLGQRSAPGGGVLHGLDVFLDERLLGDQLPVLFFALVEVLVAELFEVYVCLVLLPHLQVLYVLFSDYVLDGLRVLPHLHQPPVFLLDFRPYLRYLRSHLLDLAHEVAVLLALPLFLY